MIVVGKYTLENTKNQKWTI